MKLSMIAATLKWEGYLDCLSSWTNHTVRVWETQLMENDLTGEPLLQSYQSAYENTNADILGYIHDDLVMNDPLWYSRVMREFSDPSVGMVGFAGALGHGSPDLYTSPYRLPNLARQNFLSNLKNAEACGRRFLGSCDVAILDGLALFVRRDILDRAGGWDINSTYFLYSEWLCCEARRQGYRIRLVGCACDHLGAKTSTIANITDSFEDAHKYLYENNRDVLPFYVRGGA